MTPTAAHAVADVLVVFGITGNHWESRSGNDFPIFVPIEEARSSGLPVVGVAVDWTIDDLVQRARESIIAMLRSSTTASSTSS
jgi:hypothetical protein